MTFCKNLNTVDYRLSLEKGLDPFQALVELDRTYKEIQNVNPDVDVNRSPIAGATLKDVIYFKKQVELYTPELKQKLQKNIELLSEDLAILDYLTFGKIRTINDILNEDVYDFEAYDNNGMSINEIVKRENSERALALAKELSNKMGVPFNIISLSEFKDMFPGKNPSTNPAFFKNGEVYFVDGLFHSGTVFHEFSHPFVKALEVDNENVFNELYEELSKDPQYKYILDNLDSENELVDQAYKREAIVRALEHQFNLKDAAPSNFISELLFHLKQLFRKIFGKKINISKLKVGTTLAEMVDLISNGQNLDFNENFVTQDDIVEFNTAYEDFVEPLKAQSLELTQTFMNEFYLFLENQIKNLKGDNTIYDFIKEDLVNDSSTGYIEQVRKSLNNLAYAVGDRANKNLGELNIAVDSEAALIASKIEAFAKMLADIDVLTNQFEKKYKQLEAVTDRKSDSFFDSMLGMITYLQNWKDYYSDTLIPETPSSIPVKNEKGGLSYIINPMKTRLNAQNDIIKDLLQKLNKMQSDSVINILYESYHVQNENIISSLEKKLQLLKSEGLTKAYEKVHVELYGLSLAERNELRSLSLIGNPTLEELRRKETLLTYATYGYDLSKDSFKRILSGQSVDASKMSGLFESYASSQDAVVGTFYMYLKNSFNEVHGNIISRREQFLSKLQPLLKAAGYDNKLLGEGSMGKAISHIIVGTKKLTDGTIVEFNERRFLSNFKDWEFPYQNLKQDLTQKFEQYKYSLTDADRDAYFDALEALDLFEEKYMHREFTPEYYELQKVFKTPIGRKAYLERTKVYDTINLINSQLSTDPNNAEYKIALVEAWSEYRNLFSIYDKKGELKSGEAYDIAKLLNDYNKENQKTKEWVELTGRFEEAFEMYVNKLDPNDPLFENHIENWLRSNTTVRAKDEYYERRTELLERRKELLEYLNEENRKYFDLTDYYDELHELLKVNRDEYNIIDGTQMSLQKQKRILELQEQIASVTDNYLNEKGFTKRDTNYYRSLRIKISKNQKLSPDELDFFEEYENNMGQLAYVTGLTKADLKELNDINEELRGLSETVATQSYIDTFHDKLFGSNNYDKWMEFAENRGYVFANDDYPDAQLVEEAITDISFMNSILSDLNDPFTIWFKSNHYLDENIFKYGSSGNLISVQEGYRKTASWKTTRPKTIGSFESKSASLLVNLPSKFVSNGVLVLDDFPVTPNRQYYVQEVKSEYQTKQIFRDEIDQNGNLILANVDNRGNFLPRDYVDGMYNSAADSQFVDANYKDLFNTNRPLFDLLDFLKNEQLNSEESLSKNSKIYLNFPSIRKGSVESLDSNYLSRKKLRAEAFLLGADDDYEYGANTANSIYTGVEKINSLVTFSRPISGNYQVDEIDVSTNIVASLMQRLASIEEYKVARKKSSISSSVKSTLINSMMSPELSGLSEKLNTFLKFNTEEIAKNERVKQIKKIVDHHINGVSVTNGFDNQRMDALASKSISALQSKLATMAFAGDIVKGLRNKYGGSLQMWKKTLDQGGYSGIDLFATKGKVNKFLYQYITQRYSNNTTPIEIQLMGLLNAIPDRVKGEASVYGSQTLQQDIFEGNWRFALRKYLSDSTPIQQMYALLHANKIVTPKGEKPLYDLIEIVDGKIQTTSDVPEEWSIKYDSEGNVQLGLEIKKIMNYHSALLNKNLGIESKLDEPSVYRTMLGKISFTMVKFFPGMLMDRFQFKGRTNADRRNKALKLNFTSRKNLNTNRLEIGTSVAILQLLNEAIDRKGRFYKLRTYSPEAIVGVYQLLAGIALQVLIGMLIKSFWFDTDDDEVNDLQFDPEAENIFSDIKNKPTSLPNFPFISDKRTITGTGNHFDAENYLKLQLLSLVTAVEQEEKTFNPIQMATTILKTGTLNNALGDGGAVKEVVNLAQLLLKNEEDQYYKKEAGPYVWQEKDSWKVYNAILKLQGVNGSMLDPASTVKNRYNFRP